jgi:ubiquinone/menaquinone biosynthesis C-methylase UbiE
MEKQNITSGFQLVDNAQHQFLIQFLEDVSNMPDVQKSLELQIKELHIQKGDHVLDVGCGIGIQALEMTKHVGAEGKVIGTDLSAVMVDISRSRAAGSLLPPEFIVADALHQPFPDHSFDGVRSERVLMYIKDTNAVLQEFKRLLKPGGRLVIFDFDWDTILIPHRDKALTRKIIRYAADSFPSGRVGGELFRYFRNFGFKEVKVQTINYTGSSEVILGIAKKIYEGISQSGITEKVFTEEEITKWWQAVEEDQREGNFLVSFPGIITSGTAGK